MNSFKLDNEIYVNLFGLPHKFIFANYRDAWVQGGFSIFVKNSVVLLIVSIAMITVSSVITAFALSRKDLYGRFFWKFLILLALIFPSQSMLMPLFIRVRDLGLYDSLFGVALIYTATRLSFSTFIINNFYERVPKELEEAAVIDGANDIQLLRYIYLPLGRSAVLAATIFNSLTVWNDLWYPLVFLSSRLKKTLPIGLLSFAGENIVQFGKLFAGIMIVAIFPLTLYIVFQKYFEQGVSEGALKG